MDKPDAAKEPELGLQGVFLPAAGPSSLEYQGILNNNVWIRAAGQSKLPTIGKNCHCKNIYLSVGSAFNRAFCIVDSAHLPARVATRGRSPVRLGRVAWLGDFRPVPVNASAPNDLVALQDLIIAAARTDIEVGMGVSELLHFSATIKECFKLLVGHTSCLTTNLDRV